MGFFRRLLNARRQGGGTAPMPASRLTATPDDESYLRAAPQTPLRRRLLWMDPNTLGLLANSHTLIQEGNQLVEAQFSTEDINWARRVNEYALKAEQAGKMDQHQRAIELYKDALRLAPGCDLYLMSIGCCYANLGDLRRGL